MWHQNINSIIIIGKKLTLCVIQTQILICRMDKDVNKKKVAQKNVQQSVYDLMSCRLDHFYNSYNTKVEECCSKMIPEVWHTFTVSSGWPTTTLEAPAAKTERKEEWSTKCQREKNRDNFPQKSQEFYS